MLQEAKVPVHFQQRLASVRKEGLRIAEITMENGMYAANDLPAGPYKVHFDDCVGPDDYAPEWNGGGRDQSLAPIVTVTVGTTTQVNADLDPWGAIIGAVEDTGGSAIRDICVRAFDQLGQGVGWSRTDANGMFTLKIRSLLGTGSYKVRFKDCIAPFEFVPEWNDDRRLPRRVPWVTVTLGDDTEVNAALQPWGAITGTVTDEITSMPLPDICVRVFWRFPRRAPRGIGWARTDAAGTYQVIIRKMWFGRYKVRFSDCIQPRGYVTEFYDNTFDRWLPTFVIVQRGVIAAGIDAALSRGSGGGGGGGGSLPLPPPIATVARSHRAAVPSAPRSRSMVPASLERPGSRSTTCRVCSRWTPTRTSPHRFLGAPPQA
jgi:hypothetical protein